MSLIILNIFTQFKAITFVSSNPYKVREVKLILGDDFPWLVLDKVFLALLESPYIARELKCQALELVEPQSNAIDISMAKCKEAVDVCDGPVIVEDTSLCFNALNGLPGPYIKVKVFILLLSWEHLMTHYSGFMSR